MLIPIIIFTFGIICATILCTCLVVDSNSKYDKGDVVAIVGLASLALTLLFAGGLGIFFGLAE